MARDVFDFGFASAGQGDAFGRDAFEVGEAQANRVEPTGSGGGEFVEADTALSEFGEHGEGLVAAEHRGPVLGGEGEPVEERFEFFDVDEAVQLVLGAFDEQASGGGKIMRTATSFIEHELSEAERADGFDALRVAVPDEVFAILDLSGEEFEEPVGLDGDPFANERKAAFTALFDVDGDEPGWEGSAFDDRGPAAGEQDFEIAAVFGNAVREGDEDALLVTVIVRGFDAGAAEEAINLLGDAFVTTAQRGREADGFATSAAAVGFEDHTSEARMERERGHAASSVAGGAELIEEGGGGGEGFGGRCIEPG